MPPAVRLTDMAACPNDAHGCTSCPHPTVGPAVGGSTNVFINSLPAIRLGDPGIHSSCCGPNQWKTAKGSGTVYVNGKPQCRMGDKTTHCGGDGKLINGSPNVFIDDGAAGAMSSKLLKALEQASRDALYGKYKDKSKSKKGDWKNKNNKGGKGKGKKGAGGEDLAKDAEADNTEATGGIVKTTIPVQAARPEEKVPFEVDVADGCSGTIKVEIFEKSGDEEKSVTQTSVTADGTAQTLKGSFKAPALENGKKKILIAKASLPGKKESVSNECVVTDSGVVLYLFDEQHGDADPDDAGEEPTGQRDSTTVRLTASALKAAGIQGPVKAKVTIDGDAHDVTFNDEGIAVIPPKVSLPKGKPGGGEPYEETDVEVKITSPSEMQGKYKVRAFAPKGG